MAESNNGNQGFKALQDSSGKENYDRLFGKHLDLLDWLSDLNQSFLKFDDIKRAIKRSSTIDLKDLDASTIDILLKFNCFDLFWKEKLFCNRVQEELDLIKIEDNLNLSRKLCGQEILILLENGKYTTGAYSLGVVENADIQKRINKHNHLKVVQLITSIAKDVLVGVLKGRLLGANFGYALTGMKKRLLPQLNTHGRQVLYPEGSSYSGDFSDLDISLIYIILRNINTIAPHSNDWGNVPNDCDRSLSANIDRIRIFKNKYVSHCSNMTLNDQDLKQTVKEIRQCILELGGDDYMCDIDSMLTSEINPVIEQELCITLRRLKDADRETELNYIRLKEDINEIKQHLRMPDRQPINKAPAANGSFGKVYVRSHG
ncbi:unnamed protein product [Mytilus edulis]|uniref:DZIP3-like HEPN domain-containing protein n=1 Tax=Mytilus edulis TaxID=6550 RepID=A0A8S3R1K8_MYTED|nr:unnamed protein product [Mytilus edulis]